MTSTGRAKREFLCPTGYKRAFPTEDSAKIALSTIRKVAITNEIPRRAYQCSCGKWHLTKKPNRAFRKYGGSI